MQESIIKYLQGKYTPVSAVEIVEQVLKIKVPNNAAADKIMEGVIKNSADLYRTRDGLVALRKDEARQNYEAEAVCLCQVTPSRTPAFLNGAILFCARFENNHESGRLIIKSNEIFGGVSAQATPEYFTQLKEMINDAILVFDGFGNQLSIFKRILAQVTGYDLKNPIVSLYRLAKRLFPGSVIKDTTHLAELLGEKAYYEATPELQFAAFIEQYKRIGELCSSRGITQVENLLEIQKPDKIKVGYEGYAFDEMFLSSLPELPGVYLMKDAAGQVIYVGKSKNLHNRLNSYFLEMENPGAKLEKIRDSIYEIQITLTGSELEALLLEQHWIDEFQPQINKQIKVHEREGMTGRLYERILLLPGAEQDKVRLYFIKPGRNYVTMDLQSDGSNLQDFRNRVESFFRSETEGVTDKKLDILASWLYYNEDFVNSIDVRKYASFDDVERLVKDYAASMQFEKGRVIQY